VSFATRQLHPQLQPYADYAIAWAKSLGIVVTVTSVGRSSENQARLREQFEDCLRRGQRIWPGNPDPRCRYPANRPGDSAHEYGLAWDSDVPDQHQETWTAIRRQVGWHVPENDRVHAELPSWRQYLV
jgi:hypothetical protein